jgi:uncharacterized membrane protein SpoIIM required for sporulation
VNLERFSAERRGDWLALDGLVRDARRRPERLGTAGVRQLGELYRAASADLARARQAFPGDPVTIALERRVLAARQLVYQAPTRREPLLAFFAHDYWRSVRARWLPLVVAASLLFGSACLAGAWAHADPGAAAGVAPGAYEPVTRERPHGADLGLSRSERAGMAGEIFTNNIKVTLLAFAGGVTAGIGTVVLLLFNGLQLGVVAGLAIGSGNGRTFFELVTAHGVLELSCIVVAAAAALRLGWALVEPGRKTRAVAVGGEAREAIGIVFGTAPWLVVAGLVEGFLTPAGAGLGVNMAVGAGLAGLYWTLVLKLGRS